MSTDTKQPTYKKLYQQDIVQRTSEPHTIGIVLRTWQDSEHITTPAVNLDPILKPLGQGEVGVAFLGGNGREIIPEADLRLIDRTMQPGDICKRSIDDVRSAVITKVRVEARVEHAVSGEPVDGWWTSEHLEHSGDPDVGEYVVMDDWIGQIIETYDESLVEAATGQVIRLPEISSRLYIGEKGNDIFPTSTSSSRLMNFLRGNRIEGVDTVVAIRHTVYAIAWMAINQSLDTRVAEKKSRPQRFWYGRDIQQLTVIHGRSDLELRVGDHVAFRNPTPATLSLPITHHGREGEASGLVTVQTYVVAETRTTFSLLWQDGSRETVPSTEVTPYYNPDEHDCWPGDQVIWKSENQKRPAIVQSVNADRTARILFSDGKVELVSLLELDPHGTLEMLNEPQGISDGLGVYRGDLVFLHPEGMTNGLERPKVPRIGELEGWVHEAQGQMRGWRKEMADIGDNLANEHPKTPNFAVSRVTSHNSDFHWLGEVTDLKLDGLVEITHPDGVVATYPLERLTKFDDEVDQTTIEEVVPPDMQIDDPGHGEIWGYTEGLWDPSEDDWESEEEEMVEEEEPKPREAKIGSDGDVEVDMSDGWDSDAMDGCFSDGDDGFGSHRRLENPIVKIDLPPLDHRDPSPSNDSSLSRSKEVRWKRFDILPGAPADHAFYQNDTLNPTRSFVTRLAKEYRVLDTSLPDSIIVRAYEDRADLLRTLIIGPENTPYQDAPFVIDWQLDSNFPQQPPRAHFWSWTNGNGRVNPNLYEEGKVCLSILGTWAGDKTESWNPTRSSLLQALVSIQGLVLVKEPWFCEPAYEKLRGTEEAAVNSRLYNERAYVLSRGFVRRALELPVTTFEKELRWIYYDDSRLERIVAGAEALIEKSKTTSGNMIIPEPVSASTDSDAAVPQLTNGGIISLERTLTKLKTILTQYRAGQTPIASSSYS